MTLLDLDPNLVKPGWTPLLITIAIGVALVLLFLSMRRQFRKINATTYPGDEPAPAAPPTQVADSPKR